MQLGGNSLACLLRRATIKQKKFLLLDVKQRNEVVRKPFYFDPKTSAHPRCLAWRARLLFPLASSLSVSPFLSPLALLGPVTAQALSLYREVFFFLLFLGACCSLFDLAAISTRQTVSTFNPPVCSLHLWFGRCACTWCSCVHTLTLGWWSRAHKGAQIAHNSAQ